jgi:hypothetical protein
MGHIDIEEKIKVLDNGSLDIQSTLSLLEPSHISFLLNYYSQLKQEVYENLNSDLR